MASLGLLPAVVPTTVKANPAPGQHRVRLHVVYWRYNPNDPWVPYGQGRAFTYATYTEASEVAEALRSVYGVESHVASY